MTEDINFTYRLPLTYVRVVGTRTTTQHIDDKAIVECKAAVTTELAADFLTKIDVSLTAERMATQKATWNLTADGRLTGADVTTTVEPMAGLAAGLKSGAMVLGVAGPALLAAGPPGWIALAGAVGATSLASGVATHMAGHRNLTGGGTGIDIVEIVDSLEAPSVPDDVTPGNWGVHASYVTTNGEAAKALANLRYTLATAEAAHARAALAAAQASSPGDLAFWDDRLRQLQRLLASASAGAARAEARYAVWMASQVVATTASHDYRFRIDLMPTEDELQNWVGSTSKQLGYPDWVSSLDQLHTAVSIDMEPLNGDDDTTSLVEFSPRDDERVYYRPPRPAIVRVWEAMPTGKKTGPRFTLRLIDIRRVQVARPGNETSISIQTGLDSTNAVAVTFDETGALTKVASEIKDPILQRASDVSGLLDMLGTAVTAGKDLREALSPPSLVDQAAEAKAAAELGLVDAPPDALKDLKAQVAEQQLRAQLALAQQLQSASSVPVFVTVSHGATS